MNENPARMQRISCQQVLREDASVSSVQWMALASCHAGDVSPERLLERYLAHARRFTLSLVRPVRTPDRIDFRLIATRLNLLSFGAPLAERKENCRCVTLRISGGFLVQPREWGKGKLFFISEADGEEIRVVVRLTGYFPLLLGSRRPPPVRKLLYRLTQSLLHKVVTVRFLARLYQELEGRDRRVRVVKVRGEGEDI